MQRLVEGVSEVPLRGESILESMLEYMGNGDGYISICGADMGRIKYEAC